MWFFSLVTTPYIRLCDSWGCASFELAASTLFCAELKWNSSLDCVDCFSAHWVKHPDFGTFWQPRWDSHKATPGLPSCPWRQRTGLDRTPVHSSSGTPPDPLWCRDGEQLKEIFVLRVKGRRIPGLGSIIFNYFCVRWKVLLHVGALYWGKRETITFADKGKGSTSVGIGGIWDWTNPQFPTVALWVVFSKMGISLGEIQWLKDKMKRYCNQWWPNDRLNDGEQWPENKLFQFNTVL